MKFQRKPWVFSTAGIHQDIVMIMFTNVKTDQNKTISIDFKLTLEVRLSIVEPLSDAKISQEIFFDISKGFPCGLHISESGVVVRDPIVAEGQELICFGEIQQNSHVQILQGIDDSLIAATHSAAKESMARSVHQNFVFLVDCISRVSYLEDKFIDELNGVKTGEIPLFGVLTLGEIANSGVDFLLFYNKTCVVATG